MAILRTLQPGDEALLEKFLLQHADTSMFLRSNWREAGLLDQGARFQGTYIAAIANETIVAVAARHWILVAEDTPIAYTTFNAWLPDIVQIGGVWTPPALRSRGYAKCVVAGSLLEARSHGVERAILFTNRENHAAQAAYRGIGFRTTGEEFGLVIFSD
ncbi:MAG: GNAT family N-acetyltransferase [Nostoc sp. TH1S01]|nr:GNAT family N-acetyltransferase [Nostoc sp. TH1S01]